MDDLSAFSHDQDAVLVGKLVVRRRSARHRDRVAPRGTRRGRVHLRSRQRAQGRRVLLVHKTQQVVAQTGQSSQVALGRVLRLHRQARLAHLHRRVPVGGGVVVRVPSLRGRDHGHARSAQDQLAPVHLRHRGVRAGVLHRQTAGRVPVQAQRNLTVGRIQLGSEVDRLHLVDDGDNEGFRKGGVALVLGLNPYAEGGVGLIVKSGGCL